MYATKKFALGMVACKRRISQNLTEAVSKEECICIINSICETSLINKNGNSKNFDEDMGLLDSLYTAESLREPYITKILEETKPENDKIILHKWKLKMIKSMGKEQFQLYMKEILSTGKCFHETLETYFDCRDLDKMKIDLKIDNYWKSVSPMLSHVGKIKMMEKRVFHPKLLYSGRVDCVATFKDVLCVIDWKTSRKPKPTLRDCYDEPFQIAAYVGAINAMGVFPTKITNGVLVKAYEDGTIAHAHQINRRSMELFWFKFLRRLAMFHIKNLKLGDETDIDKI